MNRFEFVWVLCTISMLFSGCGVLKEFLGSDETAKTAEDIANDALTGNYAGAAAKAGGLVVACLLAVLGIRKAKSRKAALAATAVAGAATAVAEAATEFAAPEATPPEQPTV